MQLLSTWLAGAWNAHLSRREERARRADLDIGAQVSDGEPTGDRAQLRHGERSEHLAVFGRTGSGKSSLLKRLCAQDVRARRGFVFFDLHGDAVPELLGVVADEERRSGEDLSVCTVVLNPAEIDSAVGLDMLGSDDPFRRFVEVSELVEILKRRWNLEALGGRTEELLRNALLLVADAGLTFVDLPLLLTSRQARRSALRYAKSEGAAEYFAGRFDRMSDAMQVVFREAVLNKVTVFTADPHFRAVLGQQKPAFRLEDAVEQGHFVFVMLPRGVLGVEAQTFGSLILARLKHALFGRSSRALFTVFADEFQSLSGFDVGVDELLSESRKFGVSVVAASQFLAQHSVLLQHALLSVGTHAFFRLSGPDAARIAPILGGGAGLGATLADLPTGELVFKTGTADPVRVRVPSMASMETEISDLEHRITERWARRREDVEDEIRLRAASLVAEGKDALEGWK